MEIFTFGERPEKTFLLFAKSWKVMRLLTFLFLAASMQISARGYSQNVNITASGISLQEAFSRIEQQTGYSFFINHSLLEKSKPVNLHIRHASITDALDSCLVGQPLSYVIIDRTVILRASGISGDPGQTLSPPDPLSGSVTDSATGRPLAGVTIQVAGSNTGTTTDKDGRFSIAVSQGDVLVLTYVGYNRKVVRVNGQTAIHIEMGVAATSLNQLVIVGYGTQKKGDLTGAIASLDAKNFDKGVNTSLDQLLKGKVAGVQVVQNSAEPGGGMSISIRGASSINAGTGPLYVIDGLPIDNSAAISGTGTEYVTTRSPHDPLSTINPADIASIEILKDASATAIYGSRGANGVIMITTKKGSEGALRVSYNMYMGVQNVAHKIDLLTPKQYQTVLNELITEGAATQENHVDDFQQGTDWQSALFRRNASVQSHNLSFTGGTAKSSYYVSLNYFNQDGVVKSSSFKRYGARINLDTKASEHFEMGLNLSTSYAIDDYVPVGFGINGEAGTIYAALNFDPTLPLKDADGKYTTSSYLDIDNPLALAYGSNALANTYRTFGTVFGKYTLLPGLSVKINLGGDILSARKDVYVSRLTKHGNPQGGIATILQGQNSNYLAEVTASYDKVFGKHQLDAVLGTTTQRFVTNNTNMDASQFPADATQTYNIGLGTQSTYGLGSGKTANRLLSYLGRVNYQYGGKYLLTASFRMDGSSRFGVNNRFGYFPSFAAAWKVNEEDFMKGLTQVSMLKLRASWGQTGNQEIGDYAALTTFGAGATAILDDAPVTSTAPARLPNPDLKWETTAQTDIGLDIGLFNDRITATVDYYNKKTFNMLLNMPVPTSTGFQSKLSNVGSIRNKGWEFTLSTKNITGNFSWNTNIALSTIKNTVLSLGSVDQIITGGAGQTSDIFLIQPGLPLYSFYGYKIIGIWQKDDDYTHTTDNVQPGDLKYKDVNGDGTVNAEDRVPLGNSFPKVTWSIGNSFAYKHFTLDVFIEGSQGVSMLNNNLVDAYFPVQFRRNRFARPYLNRWTPEHPSTKYPSFINPTDQGSKLVNSYTVEDASYARIKTATLGYNWDTKNRYFQHVNVYISCENLYTFTHYAGYDPAVNPNGNVFQRVDFNAYPVARNFIAGLSINF